MTGRDRLVLIIICTLALPAALWFLAVAPERKQAAKLETTVNTASAQLATAEGELANARSAEARYSAAYASIVSLGKAVPPGEEVPSLVYQLDQASNQKRVEFSSVVSAGAGGPGGSTASAASAGAASAPAASAAASTAFRQMPFTFVFNGTFFDLYDLFQQLNQFTERSPSGVLKISGRLLTIQSVKLDQPSSSGPEPTNGELSGTITASAYVLPASQGLTAGATPAAPAGVAAPASSSASSPATPAIARVTP